MSTSKFSDKDHVLVVSANSHFFGQKGVVVGDALDYLVSDQVYYYVRLDLRVLPPLLFNENQLAYTE